LRFYWPIWPGLLLPNDPWNRTAQAAGKIGELFEEKPLKLTPDAHTGQSSYKRVETSRIKSHHQSRVDLPLFVEVQQNSNISGQETFNWKY